MLITNNYRVVTALSTQKALDVLHEGSFDVLLYQCAYQYPTDHLDEFLSRCVELDPYIKTIVISDGTNQFPIGNADADLFKPSSAEILDSIKILSARKRGPHKRQVSSMEVLA
jgi:hypothetical protein